MLVLVRFAESDDAATARLLDDASALLVALTDRPGFGGGRLVRSTDLDGGWVLAMEWATMGDWRRAFSPYDLRMQAMTFFAQAQDAPNSYEVLLDVGADGAVTRSESDRLPLGREFRPPGS
ncbi:MAG TPA: hypothetical protein VGX45_02275 [Solirubrobacteraceae bacterium]|nr:hypothetical protein [Solirubrobacteraceae bacterium]